MKKMKLTLDNVKQDIQSGKSRMIYYSAQTLWWTHLAEDLQESMEQGIAAQKERVTELLNDPSIPEARKVFMRQHLESHRNHKVPLDPSGSPLMQTDDVVGWVKKAEAKPEHFGRHGLKALMKTHHHNCNRWCPQSWAAVNAYLDRALIFEK